MRSATASLPTATATTATTTTMVFSENGRGQHSYQGRRQAVS